MSYYDKYLKYKNKYLALKNQLAGSSYITNSAKCAYYYTKYGEMTNVIKGCALEKANKLNCSWAKNKQPVTSIVTNVGKSLGCEECKKSGHDPKFCN